MEGSTQRKRQGKVWKEEAMKKEEEEGSHEETARAQEGQSVGLSSVREHMAPFLFCRLA